MINLYEIAWGTPEEIAVPLFNSEVCKALYWSGAGYNLYIFENPDKSVLGTTDDVYCFIRKSGEAPILFKTEMGKYRDIFLYTEVTIKRLQYVLDRAKSYSVYSGWFTELTLTKLVHEEISWSSPDQNTTKVGDYTYEVLKHLHIGCVQIERSYVATAFKSKKSEVQQYYAFELDTESIYIRKKCSHYYTKVRSRRVRTNNRPNDKVYQIGNNRYAILFSYDHPNIHGKLLKIFDNIHDIREYVSKNTFKK